MMIDTNYYSGEEEELERQCREYEESKYIFSDALRKSGMCRIEADDLADEMAAHLLYE